MSQGEPQGYYAPSPYQAPANPFMEAQHAGPMEAPRPGMLTAICVMGIVLGALWIMMSLGGVATMFMANLGASFAANEEVRKLQTQMQEEMYKAMGLGLYAGYVLFAAQLLLGAALLTGGIQSQRQSERGRVLLRVACLTATAFLIFWLIIFVHNTWQATNVSTEYMPKILKAQQPPGAPGPPPELLVGITRISNLIGMGISGVIALAEGVCFILAANYLASDDVRTHFKEE